VTIPAAKRWRQPHAREYPAAVGEIKTKASGADVTAFLNSIEAPRRRAEGLEIRELMERVTGQAARMWGPAIVGFGDRPYTNASGTNPWFVLGFSPRKASLTLYGLFGDEGAVDPLFADLGPHTTSTSCLYIKRLDAVDSEILEQLVRQAWDASA